MNQTYWHDDLVFPRLYGLRQQYANHRDDALWLNEQFCGLMQAMLAQHSHVLQHMNRISASRPATREELFRRASLAHDMIRELFREPLTLHDLSQSVALSENHLIRSYKQVFGVTPHQHVIALRVQEAQRLLQKTSLPLLEICLRVGFESLGSFCSTFRQRSGHAPMAYRKLGDFREDMAEDHSLY